MCRDYGPGEAVTSVQTHGEDVAAIEEGAEVSESHLTPNTPHLTFQVFFLSELPPTDQTQGQTLHSSQFHEHQPLLTALAGQPR